MHKKVLLLLLPALLGGAILLMSWLQAGDDTLPPDLTATPTDAREGVVDVAAASGPGPTEASLPGSRGDMVRAEAAVAAEGSAPIPEDATWVEIRIVDKATAEPVADAAVVWYDNSAHERMNKDKDLAEEDRSELWRDGEALAAKYGWRTRSDRRGIARVHVADWTQVLARHENLYGSKSLQKNTVPPRDGHQLQIVPDLQALVAVVDQKGQPAAGVPIAITQHDAQGKLLQMWNWGAVATTRAPDGIATLRHLQEWLANTQEQGNKVAAWRVRTFLPGHEDQGVGFSPEAPPAEPIVLRLPATGRVRVRAELHGAPLPDVTNVNLNENTKDRNRFGRRATVSRRPDASGWAVFAHVPLGASFHAGANVMSGWLQQQFQGPMSVDQEVSVVLTPADDQIMLVGRLLDDQRTPLADQEFRLQVRGPQMRDDSVFRTDAAGRFLVILGRAQKETKNNRLEQMTIDLARPGDVALRAQVPARELVAGRQDLGDLVLRGGALVVSGRFVTGDRPYKPAVGVSVERWTAGEGRETEARWRRVQDLLYHKRDDGHFEWRGAATPGRYRLQFAAYSHLPIEPIEFQLGTTDLVVQVAAGSSLAASALLPKDLPGDLKAALVLEGATAAPVPTPNPRGRDRLVTEPWSNEEGRYQMQWQAVPPGSYTLEFRLWTDPQPALRIDGVQVPPPEGGDPRLVDIDLRDVVRVLTVRFFGQDGKPLSDPNGVMFPLGQPPAAEWLGFQIHDHTTRLLTRPSPLDLLVAVHGHRPQQVRAVGETLDVRLDAWPSVEFVFPSLPALPEGVELSARLRPAEASEARYRSQWSSGARAAVLGAPDSPVTVKDGRARIPIADGPHQLDLQLQQKRRQVPVALEPAVRVLPNAGTVAVEIPAATMQKALEQAQAPQPPQK